MPLTLNSPAFADGDLIPSKYTCDGEDLSPTMNWESPPDGTRSFVLIVDDPDAPVGTWVHWVVFNIPQGQSSLEEGVPPDPRLSGGALQGTNSWKRIGYGGPCPPGGLHRYFFKLYALDSMLQLEPGASKGLVVGSMEGHVLALAQWMGKYRRH